MHYYNYTTAKAWLTLCCIFLDFRSPNLQVGLKLALQLAYASLTLILGISHTLRLHITPACPTNALLKFNIYLKLGNLVLLYLIKLLCMPTYIAFVIANCDSFFQNDVEMPIPKYFTNERAKALKEREKVLGQILAKMGPKEKDSVSVLMMRY